MCMMVFDDRDNTKVVDQDILKRALDQNNDGMGMMFSEDGTLHYWHSMKDFNDLYKRYVDARSRKCPVALHFRKGTKGTDNFENLHPFSVGTDFGMMHNGTLSWLTKELPENWSDTRYFSHHIIPQLPSNFLSQAAFRIMLHELADGDRMLFMDGKGRHTIINESIGFWDFDVWYSHGRYKTWMLTGAGSPSTNYQSNFNFWEKDNFVVAKDFKNEVILSTGFQPKRTGHIRSMLVFDYGLLDSEDIETFGMKSLGVSTVNDYQLWAVTDVGSDIDDINNLRPSMIPRSGISTVGTVYRVEEGPMLGLDELHDYYDEHFGVENGLYTRKHIDVKLPSGSVVKAWVYVGVMDTDATELEAPIPGGDWADWRWVDALSQTEEFVISGGVISDDSASTGTGNIVDVAHLDSAICPKCTSTNTSEWDGRVEKASENGIISIPTKFLFCIDCQQVSKAAGGLA